MTLRVAVTALAALVCGLWAAGAAAQSDPNEVAEFRVENRLFVDNEKEPHSESTTIFFHGIVYDYLKKPAEVTVFDKARGRFVLLDVTRRVHTEIGTDKISAFTEALRQRVLAHSDPLVQFLAEPKFEEHLDEAGNQLTFSSPSMTYRLTTIPADSQAIARQYREFSDWYSRLNTLLTPGSRPPFARMVVNAALEKRQAFPSEIQLTLRLKKAVPPKRATIRSEHHLVRRLVESDRDRVAQTDQFMAIFKRVDFGVYQEKMGE